MEARLLTILLRANAKRCQRRQMMRHMQAVCVAEPCPTHIAADIERVDVQVLVTTEITSQAETATVEAG